MPGSPLADLSIGPPSAPEVEVEAGTPPDESGLLDAELEEAPHVDESVVRAMLRAVGGGVGHIAGDPDVPDHWRFTAQELDELTPPLTRFINARPRLRRAVARGDEAVIAIVLAGYLGRNITLGQEAQRARREREADPAAAAGGAGGTHPAGPAWHQGGDAGGVHRAPGGGLP